MPEKYVRVDGIATFLRHTGATTLPETPPDVSRGEVVLCLHDATLTSGSFEGLLEPLAREHSPLAFDLPGHGRSGGIDSLGSVERLASHARGLAAKLGLRPVVLLGHGLGAAVALEWAQADPPSVRALVLCGAGLDFAPDPALVERVRRVAEGKERRFFRRECYAPDAERELLGRAFGEETRTDPRVVLGNLQALAAWNAEPGLAAARVPTLVVTGEREDDAARRDAHALAERLGAREASVAGAGRTAPLERPDGLADAVARFLGEAL